MKLIENIKKICATADIPNFYRRLDRLRWSEVVTKKRIKEKTYVELTPTEENEILEFWKNYVSKINYAAFRFYNAFCINKAQLKYYIPETIYYPIVDMFFSNAYHASIFDNKNLYDLYFHDVAQPQTICRYVNGIFLNKQYQIISYDDVISLCKNKNIILKPATGSQGGRGIYFLTEKENSNFINDFSNYISQNKNVLVSEVFHQNEVLNAIHPTSVNTIRIMTLLLDNEINILSSILRLGRDGKKVDNASSAGVFCGIDLNNGTLKKWTFDTHGNQYEGHPNGVKTENILIPNFNKCLDLVKAMVPRVMHISKLCSWDIALDVNANPNLIEVNLSCGQLDFHQICNGPIFGDLTPIILDKVFKK